MNREDIIRMAREAGLIVDEDVTSLWREGTNIEPFLVRFANLVAAAEREACVEEIRYYLAHSLTAKDILNAIRERGEK